MTLHTSKLLLERSARGGVRPRAYSLGFTPGEVRDHEASLLTRTSTNVYQLLKQQIQRLGLACPDSRVEHDGCVNTASWDDSGTRLLTGSDDRCVKVWKADGG
jgi:WD40 repeat protein